MIHVVLYQPEIPQNTGAIARQCVGMKAHLHIVKPIPFDISDKAVRRAGLDYWDYLKLTVHENRESFFSWLGDREPWIITKHGDKRFDEPAYVDDDILIFGRETGGLPPDLLALWPDRTVNVPILGNVRSYNLSNTVSIVLAQANLKAGIYDGIDTLKG
jgi:tRNA (cytidine/uridine-2'-O-)-methyltransferase